MVLAVEGRPQWIGLEDSRTEACWIKVLRFPAVFVLASVVCLESQVAQTKSRKEAHKCRHSSPTESRR